MEKKLNTGIIALVTVLIFSAANAQPLTEWEKTLRLEGYWSGQATLTLGTDVFNVTYTADFSSTAGGSGLIMNEGFSDANLGQLTGANLIGYNPNDGMIHWFSVDNFGTTHDHAGSWINPTHFYMIHQSQVGGQSFTEYIHMRLRANCTRLDLSLIATMDADTVQKLSGIFYLQNTANRAGNPQFVIDEENQISVYPNPSEGKINIESAKNINEITISNEAGQLIFKGKPETNTFVYQLEYPGIYIVNVLTDDAIESRKVIIN